MARQKNIELPVIENISSSNEFQINHTIKKINNHGSKKLGFVGLSFKPGTDDLRESPSVRLVEHFIGKGYDISIYDPHVKLSQLMGANKKFIEEQIPHISQLLCENIGTVFNKSDIIVTTRDEDFEQHLNENHHLIDLR